MSNFNINDISYICEHINNQDQFALDSESEYYDQELAEAVEDVLTTISVNMISNGHTAEGVIDFLENASEQDIIEYYINPPVISEDSVSEEYILQELARLEEGLGAVVSGLKLLGKGAMKAAAPVARTAKVAAQRMAGPGVRKAIGGAVSKVKDIAGKVAPKLPGIAKGALLAGAGVGAGYLGAKLAGGAGNNSKATPAGPQTVAAAGGKGGRVTVGKEYGAVLGGKKGKVTYSQSGEKFFKQTEKDAPKPLTGSAPSAPGGTPSRKITPQKPKGATPGQLSPGGRKGNEELDGKKFPTGKTKGGTEYEVRTPTRAEMETSKKAGGGEAGVKAAVERSIKPMGGPEGPGKIDTASIEADLKAQQERDKKRAEASTKKESYDAFDLVLEYLFETEQVETLTEASYVMMEMDSEAIQAIVESKAGFLLEEFDAIVNGLIEEGYDLSEYTEEELVDIFVAENILPAMAKLIVGINKARQLAGPTAKTIGKVAKGVGKVAKGVASGVSDTAKLAGAAVKGASKGGALAKTGGKGGALVKSSGGALVKSSGGALAKTPKGGALASTGVKPVSVKDLGTSAAKAAKGAGGGAGVASAAATAGAGKGGALVASPSGALAKGGKAGALVAGTTATGAAKAAKGALAAAGKGGRGGKAGLLAAGLLGAGALGAGMLAGRERKESPRRKEALVGSQNAKKPLTATDANMKTAADVNKKGGIALGKGGLGYLAKSGNKMVIKQAKAVGADDGIIGKAARALGLTKAKDKAIEAQRQAAGRSNREKYLKGQELTDPNVTGYQAKGAVRKGKATGSKIKMDNN
jgi:hypothetical protein